MKIININFRDNNRGILVIYSEYINEICNMPVTTTNKLLWINDKSNIGMWHVTIKKLKNNK